MPSRRKSVAFAAVEVVEEPAVRRNTRRRSHASMSEPDIDEAPTAAPPAVERSTRSKKQPVVEADGGFKFKRKKTAAKQAEPDAPPATSAVVENPRPPLHEESAPAASASLPPATLAGLAPAPAARVVADAAEVNIDPQPPAASGPTLDGVPLELLHALLEECNERASVSAATRSQDAAPTPAELAVAAITREVARRGVTTVPPPMTLDDKLREREAVLQRRIAELRVAQAGWEAASAPPPAPALVDAAPNQSVLDALPPLPDIGGQLLELGTVSDLCADQLDGAIKKAALVTTTCAADGQRLAQAVHKVSFQAFLDVEQPQALLRSLVAA